MLWMALQIGAVALNSANSILDKRLVQAYTPNPALYLLSFALVGAPVVAIGAWRVPWAGWAAAGQGVLVGLIFTGMVLLHYKAMSLEEASRLAPLARLSAVLKLALLALFLDDRLQPAQYAAFGLMILGAIVLSRRPNEGGRFALPRGAGVIGAFVGLTAVYGFLDGHIILTHSPWVLQLWSNVGILLGTGVVLMLPAQRRALRRSLAAAPHRIRLIILGEQTGRLVTGVLSDVAISVAGSAAIIAVVGGLRPLLVLILAARFLGEELTRAKVGGVSLIVLGTIILLIDL